MTLLPLIPTVNEGRISLRERGTVFGGDDKNIAVAQDVIRILIPSAITVRDRVAVEMDAGAGLNDRDRTGRPEGHGRLDFRRPGARPGRGQSLSCSQCAKHGGSERPSQPCPGR